MKETSKAMRRRIEEERFEGGSWLCDVFHGVGLDVGSGDDPLSNWCANCVDFNLPDGGGDSLEEFIRGTGGFNFIHGSQVLEHARNPRVMLQSWINLLKPGGHIVATVPDFTLYEKRYWPSQWNAGHRSKWTMEGLLDCINLPQWLNDFEGVTVQRCKLIDVNYDYNASAHVDQTYDYQARTECFLEFVLLKP